MGDTVFVEFPNHTTFTATVSKVKYSIQTPDNREIEISNVKKINLKQGRTINGEINRNRKTSIK